MRNAIEQVKNWLDNQVFNDEDFLNFLDFSHKNGYLSDEEVLFLKQSLEDSEVKNILKIWIQAEGLYYFLEWGTALCVGTIIASQVGEVNFSSLGKGTLMYAGIMIPAIMTTRFGVLKILTQLTPVPDKAAIIVSGLLPVPTPLILPMWLKDHGKFLKQLLLYKRTIGLRNKIEKEDDVEKKEALESKYKSILTGEDWLGKTVQSVKMKVRRLTKGKEIE